MNQSDLFDPALRSKNGPSQKLNNGGERTDILCEKLGKRDGLAVFSKDRAFNPAAGGGDCLAVRPALFKWTFGRGCNIAVPIGS